MKRKFPRKNVSSKKKGSLEETLSYSLFKDDPSLYLVSYRDKDRIVEANLKDFMNSEEYQVIPVTRITLISKNDKIVWKKGQKEVLVKKYLSE